MLAKLKKTVRFYEPMLFTSGTAGPTAIANGFWAQLHTKVTGLAEPSRMSAFRNITYVGEARRPLRPATTYFYVGRFRPAAEHPDNWRPGVGVTGAVQPAQKNDRITEPTFMVPFGARNFVAIMHPSGAPTSTSAIDAWLNKVSGTIGTNSRIQLVPVVDLKLDEKLNEAFGATSLVVSILPGSDVPASGGGEIGEDLRRTAANAPTNATVEVKVSFENRKAPQSATSKLLDTARWVRLGDWAKKAKTTLQAPTQNGIKTEKHDLVEDRVVLEAKFEIQDGTAPTEYDLLTAMNKAISDFGVRMARQ